MSNYMYGCDICQQVCPWNRFSKPHSEESFIPKHELLAMSSQDWQDLSEETFTVLFEGSAVKRTRYSGLRRNIDFLMRHKE
jgi:epoxyqueuosine reductase